MANEDCIFCKIADGRLATDLLYEDERCVAFNDLDPQAPIHILVIPKRHIDSLDTAGVEDKDLIGHLLFTVADLARSRDFAEDGYRTVINTNGDGGQTIFHLHVHLLAGRQFVFPPG